MQRIINAACPPDGIVLDPFCGCGTTVDAAVRLKRQWIGIDITYIAVDLIRTRLIDTYGPSILKTFDVLGIPHDVESAQALFDYSPFDFERWAVSLIGAQPNEKQVGDKGIDGQSRFPIGNGQLGRILVSVKGGKSLNPAMARDLEGTLSAQKADIGILITLTAPTKGVQEVINKGGNYTHPGNGQAFPRLQTFTIAELLAGKKPQTPATFLPYLPATKLLSDAQTEALF